MKFEGSPDQGSGLSGAHVASRWVRHTAERHLRDFEAVDSGHRTDLLFDPEAAQRILDFCTLCRHVKGPLAKPTWLNPETGRLESHPFEPEPWQQFILANLFGWKMADTGLRRFTRAYIEIPRKNGKSYLAAVILLYCFAADGEEGAEIYSVATKKDQARLVFDLARAIVLKSPALRAHIEAQKHSLTIPERNSTFLPLSSDYNTLDGLNTHAYCCDELHAHPTRDVLDVIEESTAAREQPLGLIITTSGWNLESPCGEEHEYAKAVLDPKNPYQDDRHFAFISSLDEGDDWTDEKVWGKANPNLGVSVRLDYLRGKVQKAQEQPSLVASTLRKHFCVWHQGDEGLFDLDTLDACREPLVDPEALVGERCFAGLDLSSTRDTTALLLYFPETRAYDVPVILCWCWIPADGLRARQRRDKAPYLAWVKEGYLRTTPGAVVNYREVERTILEEVDQRFDLREVAADRHNFTATMTRLTEAGLIVAPMSQSAGAMNAGTRELLRLITSRSFSWGGNPVFRWMASNTCRMENRGEEMKPTKKTKNSRIDLIDCLVMAIDRAMRHGSDPLFDGHAVVASTGQKRDAYRLFDG